MAIAIRLARGGAKKRPFYRIVVADTRSPRDGRFIERLGFYNPMVAPDHPERQKVDGERAKYWLSQGAKPSDRVHRILEKAGAIEARRIPEQTKKNKPKKKAQERAAEEEKRQAELEAKREEARKEQAEKEAEEARKAEEAEQTAEAEQQAEAAKAAENKGEAPAEESGGDAPAEESGEESKA